MAQAEASTPDKPIKPKRRWFQFSLRMLLILTTVIAIGLGWLSHRAHRQREAVAAIKAAGGLVGYDFQRRPWSTRIYGPSWLEDAIGVDYFANVERVRLNTTNVADADVAYIKGLTRLKVLSLRGPKVTNAGLEHLKGLTELRALQLENTSVTDAGLEQIRGLTKLQRLVLQNTAVTEAGIARLQRALPKCRIDH